MADLPDTGTGGSADAETGNIRAAEYVRMSTEHQRYSTQNQSDAIHRYATQHNMEVVRTYSDFGKSGLNIEGRAALRQLIADVEGGDTDYEVILVYDVSRWGRFQDADESAFYEYVCRRNGVSIHYCAEQFVNDGSPVSTIIKGVKRAMAGEYSRELSTKVFAGQCRIAELGYRQSGSAGVGLRRMLIDEHGNQKGELRHGERKSLISDRVILVPGPEEEVRTIRRIFRLFVHRGKGETEIARILNRKGIRTDFDREWTRRVVNNVLTNEKYIGNNVFNRTSFKLQKNRSSNPPEMWIRADGAFEPIVSNRTFQKAQVIIEKRKAHLTDQEMLDRLERLYRKHGYLSSSLIDGTEGMPSSRSYYIRFGGLRNAYQLVGFKLGRTYQYLEVIHHLRQHHSLIVAEVISKIESLGATVARDPNTDILSINGEFTISVVIASHKVRKNTPSWWNVCIDSRVQPDITVAVRMDHANKEVLDYFLLPRIEFNQPVIQLREHNGAHLDTYRFDNLDFLFYMVRRSALTEAYERNGLRGSRLRTDSRIIQQRQQRGKTA